MKPIKYRGYWIEKAYVGYGFHHDSYDGAPDSGDYRCGLAHTIEDAKHKIDESIKEEEYGPGVNIVALGRPMTITAGYLRNFRTFFAADQEGEEHEISLSDVDRIL